MFKYSNEYNDTADRSTRQDHVQGNISANNFLLLMHVMCREILAWRKIKIKLALKGHEKKNI